MGRFNDLPSLNGYTKLPLIGAEGGAFRWASSSYGGGDPMDATLYEGGNGGVVAEINATIAGGRYFTRPLLDAFGHKVRLDQRFLSFNAMMHVIDMTGHDAFQARIHYGLCVAANRGAAWATGGILGHTVLGQYKTTNYRDSGESASASAAAALTVPYVLIAGNTFDKTGQITIDCRALSTLGVNTSGASVSGIAADVFSSGTVYELLQIESDGLGGAGQAVIEFDLYTRHMQWGAFNPGGV